MTTAVSRNLRVPLTAKQRLIRIASACPRCRREPLITGVDGRRLCAAHRASQQGYAAIREWNRGVARAARHKALLETDVGTREERKVFVEALRAKLRAKGWKGNIARSNAKGIVAELTAGKGKSFTDEQFQALADLGLEPTYSRCQIPGYLMDDIAEALDLRDPQ